VQKASGAIPEGSAHNSCCATATDGAGGASVVGAGSAAVILAIRGKGAIGAVVASLHSNERLSSFRCAEGSLP
jgi:hypothetical protein